MTSTPQPRTWRTSDLIRAFALFFAFWILLQFLWLTRFIVLVVILSILFAVTLSRGVDFLEKIHVKRALGTVLILLAIVGSITGLGFLIAPTLQRQLRDLGKQIPALVASLEQKVAGRPLGRAALQAAKIEAGAAAARPPESSRSNTHGQQSAPAADKPPSGEEKSAPSDAIGGAVRFLFPFLTNTIATIGGVVLVLFLTGYFAGDPALYRRGLLALVPPPRRAKAEDVLDELAVTLRRWLLARLMAMVILGVITGGALALLGVPAAAALGLLTGLLEFIPFVGPVAAAVPAIAMALTVSPSRALAVLVLFVALQQLEGNVLTPLLLKNRLDVPPAVTVIAVALLGMVFGILGMLVAEPLGAAAILLTKRLYVERMEV